MRLYVIVLHVIKPLLTEAEFILISMHARVQNLNVQNCLVMHHYCAMSAPSCAMSKHYIWITQILTTPL